MILTEAPQEDYSFLVTRDSLIAQGSESQLKPCASFSFPLSGPCPSHHHRRLLPPPLSWGILVIPEQLFAAPKKQLNHQTSLLGTVDEGASSYGAPGDWHSIHWVRVQRLDRQFLALSIGMQALSLASVLLPCSTVVPFLHSLYVPIHLVSCGSSPSALQVSTDMRSLPAGKAMASHS